MKKVESMAKLENIPALTVNAVGLRKHFLLTTLAREAPMPPEGRRLRAWLIHTVMSAARHYSKARELVEKENGPQRHFGSGTVLFALDVFEQLEGSVTATFRACMALYGLKSHHAAARHFHDRFEPHLVQLRTLRNQFEHMHTQITAKQAGKGPISILFGDEGKTIRFRKLTMETATLHALIEGAFHATASFYPSFDAHSAPEPDGPLMMTGTIVMTEHKEDAQTPAP